MTRQNINYHNDLPELPADAILPLFQVPKLSTEFSFDSCLYKNATHEFITDSLLGVPVEFCDLSIYSNPPNADDITELDLEYMPDLVQVQPQELVMPTAEMAPKPSIHRDEAPRIQKPKIRFHKSPFYKSPEDPEIQEQLNHAFNGNVPGGELLMLEEAQPLTELLIRATEGIDPSNLLLMSREKRSMKIIPRTEEEEEVRATRAYDVSSKSSTNKCYYYIEDGKFCIGVIEKKLIVKPMTTKEMNEKEQTATPVIVRGGGGAEARPQKENVGSDDNDNDDDSDEEI